MAEIKTKHQINRYQDILSINYAFLATTILFWWYWFNNPHHQLMWWFLIFDTLVLSLHNAYAHYQMWRLKKQIKER